MRKSRTSLTRGSSAPNTLSSVSCAVSLTPSHIPILFGVMVTGKLAMVRASIIVSTFRRSRRTCSCIMASTSMGTPRSFINETSCPYSLMPSHTSVRSCLSMCGV